MYQTFKLKGLKYLKWSDSEFNLLKYCTWPILEFLLWVFSRFMTTSAGKTEYVSVKTIHDSSIGHRGKSNHYTWSQYHKLSRSY